MKYYECEDGETWVNLHQLESIYIFPNKNAGTFQVVGSPRVEVDKLYVLNTCYSLEDAKECLKLILEEEDAKPKCIHASDAKVFLAHAIEFLSTIESEDVEIKINLQLADRLITKALITLEANDVS